MREVANEMILASAGSGKTYQLSNRIVGLVMREVEPPRIAALTFTRKAAGEFADAVVAKMAEAARDGETAGRLGEELGIEADEEAFREQLAMVVKDLPRMFLGTLDSFFARVVRGFQYELGVTGGAFELIQGVALYQAQAEVLGGILGGKLQEEEAGGFVESFRRATFGREEQKVADLLGDFIRSWHTRYLEARDPEMWGGARVLEDCGPDRWEASKKDLLDQVRKELESVAWTDRRQVTAADKMLDLMESFEPVDGGVEFKGGLIGKILDQWEAVAAGDAVIKFQKEFVLPRNACAALVQALTAMARAVFEGYLTRTRAVRTVMGAYEIRYGSELRERGRLSFDDVKRLMGEWARSEEARLRREWVDFRLDGRFDHWLLDEFQDTSRSDWQGVEPLIDEAAMDAEGRKSVFVVGDRKQGIFAWRGGDVGLFDEVKSRYGIESRSMPVSERSGPDVLAMVNTVCGNREVMRRLFPEEAVAAWDFEEHRPSPRVGERRGYAEVREVESSLEERCEEIATLLEELEPRARGLSCGVLLRENKEVEAVADDLRLRGFEVVEEGKRRPASDSTFGVAVLDLFRWLANPDDRFAEEHLWLSPVGLVLDEWLGAPRAACWEAAHDLAASIGWPRMVETLAGKVGSLSDFGSRRVLELIRGLEEASALEDRSARAMARFLEEWEVEQTAGAGAIQVMTIHKSKGLGFDVVIAPGISDAKIPDLGRLSVLEKTDARGRLEWLVQSPPTWVRRALPCLRQAASDWEIGQAYESMCLLYVALTRAKMAQYVFVPPPAATADQDKPSLANWVRRSCEGGEPKEGVLAAWGDDDWYRAREYRAPVEQADTVSLGVPVPRRKRMAPASTKRESGGTRVRGAVLGEDVHALFEGIGWLEAGEVPKLPRTQAGAIVEDCLRVDRLHRLFEKPSGQVELHREQPLEVIVDGAWMSGVVDRLHVYRDETGRVLRCEVIDFKTDWVRSSEELKERHEEQLAAYREALAALFGREAPEIRCVLVSTCLKELVEC